MIVCIAVIFKLDGFDYVSKKIVMTLKYKAFLQVSKCLQITATQKEVFAKTGLSSILFLLQFI